MRKKRTNKQQKSNQQTWMNIATAEENRLGLSHFSDTNYDYEQPLRYEWSDDYEVALVNWVSELQIEIHNEIQEVPTSQRRSYLSSIFSYIFQWGQK